MGQRPTVKTVRLGMKFVLIRVNNDLLFFEREHVSDIMVLKEEDEPKRPVSRIRDAEEKQEETSEGFSVAIGIDGRQSYRVFAGSLPACLEFVNKNFGPVKSTVSNINQFLKDN